MFTRDGISGKKIITYQELPNAIRGVEEKWMDSCKGDLFGGWIVIFGPHARASDHAYGVGPMADKPLPINSDTLKEIGK